MDIVGTLKNPWVIGGGAALALVLVLMSRNSSQADQVVYTGTVSNYSGAEWLAQSAEIAAGVNVAEIEARTTERLALLDTLIGFANNQQVVGAQLSETAAGVTKTRIQTDAALRLDRQQNAARYDELFQTTNAALTLSQRQADLEELRIKESANLSRLSIGAASEQGKRTLDASVNLATIGAKTERKQIKAQTRVGVAQARAAEKAGVAQANAAPWVSFWSGASEVASSALRFIPAIPA